MIEQARARTPESAPIEYRVGHAASIDGLGQFDIVTAAFLLNYSSSLEELATTCRTIAASLRPGGRFVGTVPNSKHRADPSFGQRYGGHFLLPTDIHDGDRYTFELHLSRVVPIENYYWTIETYGRELERAGLIDFEYHPWQPSEAGVQELGEDYWAAWIANPLSLVVSARRP